MKKSIFKRVGLICCSILLAFSSFFVGVQKNGHNQNKFASADSTSITGITFNSSDIFFARLGTISVRPDSSLIDMSEFLSHSGQNQESPYWVLNWSFDITYDYDAPSNNGNLNCFARGVIFQRLNDTYGFGTLDHLTLELSSVEVSDYTNSDFDNNRGSFYVDRRFIPIKVGYSGLTSYQYTGIIAAVYIPNNELYPNLDITEIEIGNYIDFPFFTDTDLPTYLNYTNIVCYTDSNGFKYFFFIPTWYTYEQMPMSYLSYRHYFTSSGQSLTDNQLFQQGYQEGLLANQQNIYDNGFNAGYSNGYYSGRSDGIESANEYTFTGLITSVIDVPVKTVFSFLNFEILGVNLIDFFLGLLTFGIIIFVIKLLLGRG